VLTINVRSSARVGVSIAKTYSYDRIGNLLGKSDVGT
jgi:hypothetical protein